MDIASTLVYNPHCVSDPRALDGYSEASSIVKWIIQDFLLAKKICGSRSAAQSLIRSNLREGVIVTDEQIDEAYAIAAGGGCEYEWPHE